MCTTEPEFDPQPSDVRTFGFQSILASAAFSLGPPVFLLQLNLGFLNKSISGIIWSCSASADWQLLHLVSSPSGDMSRVTKIQTYLFLFYLPVRDLKNWTIINTLQQFYLESNPQKVVFLCSPKSPKCYADSMGGTK